MEQLFDLHIVSTSQDISIASLYLVLGGKIQYRDRLYFPKIWCIDIPTCNSYALGGSTKPPLIKGVGMNPLRLNFLEPSIVSQFLLEHSYVSLMFFYKKSL